MTSLLLLAVTLTRLLEIKRVGKDARFIDIILPVLKMGGKSTLEKK